MVCMLNKAQTMKCRCRTRRWSAPTCSSFSAGLRKVVFVILRRKAQQHLPFLNFGGWGHMVGQLGHLAVWTWPLRGLESDSHINFKDALAYTNKYEHTMDEEVLCSLLCLSMLLAMHYMQGQPFLALDCTESILYNDSNWSRHSTGGKTEQGSLRCIPLDLPY